MNDDDKKLWDRFVKEVKPLKKQRLALPKKPLQRHVKHVQRDEMLHHNVFPAFTPGGLAVSSPLKHERKLLKKANWHTVDLHDMTQQQAHQYLISSLVQAYARGQRHILLVTGKGNLLQSGGVIRRQFIRWLEASPLAHHISGIHPASRRDGGDGAFYIVLRRQNDLF